MCEAGAIGLVNLIASDVLSNPEKMGKS